MEEKDELVQGEIVRLYEEMPKLSEMFDIHRRIGEGTFSSVYLASLKNGKSNSRQFALKRLIPTCHPDRVKIELNCLKNIGGQNNVAGLSLCLRQKNSIVFIMPYQPHEPFDEYVGKMDALETALYIKNLLIAVAHIHKCNIIHRDIKPSNFLYDRLNKKYLLVDFGLAQKGKENAECCSKRKRESESESNEMHQAKRPLLENSPTNKTENAHKHGRRCSKENNPKPFLVEFVAGKTKERKNSESCSCKCYGRPTACQKCLTRNNICANRAGTPGFRPPEVLLKSLNQTTAVDMWAVGIMLISILSNCSNFFASPDDVTALSEMITLFGREAIQKVAVICGRHLICSENKPGFNLRKLCCQLRNRGSPSDADGATEKCRNCGCTSCLCLKSTNETVIENDLFPSSAYNLLKCLLDVNPNTRISADNALKHPFVRGS